MTDKKPENQIQIQTQPNKQLEAAPDGALLGSTLEEQYRIAKYYVQSGMLPKDYDTPEKALIGFQYAIELGLKPLTAMKNICVINGQPNLWGELPLSLVRKSGKLEYIKEYFIDDQYIEISLTNKNLHLKKYAAICVIKRVDEEEKEFPWTVDDVQQSKKGPVWANYPQIMWKRKARSIALKDVFGDILGTFDIAEYNHDRSPDVKNSMIDVDGESEIVPSGVTDMNDAIGKESGVIDIKLPTPETPVIVDKVVETPVSEKTVTGEKKPDPEKKDPAKKKSSSKKTVTPKVDKKEKLSPMQEQFNAAITEEQARNKKQ